MQLTADAALGATSLTVEALEVAWESADTATAPAIQQLVEVTADAEVGDTSLTVKALDFWINDGAEAFVGTGAGGGGRQVLAGTIMAELADGRMVPRVMRPGAETAKYILATLANEDSETDAVTGYGVIKSAAVYENLLPESSGSPKVANSTYKTELLAQGGYWMFEQYGDSSAS